ncbi:hypothetical protein NDU88_003016 [Pleurodeles waltl]|uniref:Uncharacterized protein n=1 Tax=Pleurodeles waltl TaxID=8319 RepID=A0AAV7UEL5_PLEWA|nr:hypothetical protein NDU88_003016 [Pleurodeles waltl]
MQAHRKERTQQDMRAEYEIEIGTGTSERGEEDKNEGELARETKEGGDQTMSKTGQSRTEQQRQTARNRETGEKQIKCKVQGGRVGEEKIRRESVTEMIGEA